MYKKLIIVLVFAWVIPQNLNWIIVLDFFPEVRETLKAESGLNPKAYNWDGGAEARGIAQITKKYHPEISDKQAYDPFWALTWSINVWYKGNAAKEWTCYKKLFVQNQKDCM